MWQHVLVWLVLYFTLIPSQAINAKYHTVETVDSCTYVINHDGKTVEPSGTLCSVEWGADLDETGQWVYLELPHHTVMLAVPVGFHKGWLRYTYGHSQAEWYDDDGKDYSSPAFIYIRGHI